MKKSLIALTLLALVAFPAFAQEHHKMATADHAGMDCAAMMAEHKASMAKFDDMDASLQKLVDTMNAATGQQKVDAMAAVITELATQRKAMRMQMEAMQPMMMEHMSQHMAKGAKSMEECPMMKENAKSATKSK